MSFFFFDCYNVKSPYFFLGNCMLQNEVYVEIFTMHSSMNISFTTATMKSKQKSKKTYLVYAFCYIHKKNDV